MYANEEPLWYTPEPNIRVARRLYTLPRGKIIDLSIDLIQRRRQRGALGTQAPPPPPPAFYEIIKKNRQLFPKIKSTV